MLLNIFINDILDELQGIDCPGVRNGPAGICFADDTLVFADSEQDLNLKIRLIEKWVETNEMEINLEKSGVMIINSEAQIAPFL